MVDFQRDEKGVLLARIDNTPFRGKVQQGAANTAAQRATPANSAQSLRSEQAQLESQCATVASAQPGNQKAQADMNRIAELVDEGSVSLRERDQALAALRQAQAGVRQAQAQRAIAAENLRSVSPPISQVATYSPMRGHAARLVEPARLLRIRLRPFRDPQFHGKQLVPAFQAS